MNTVSWGKSLALLSLFVAGTAIAAEGSRNPLADHVRAANNRFKDVAVATSEGYTPIPCASGVDGGAMGIHYVNAKLIGETVDIKHPQAIMYEPKPGLESEPARRLRGHEPEGQLRTRDDEIAGHALGACCPIAAASIERTGPRATAIQQH